MGTPTSWAILPGELWGFRWALVELWAFALMDKIADNHFDSYPDGLGTNMINAVHDLLKDRDQFRSLCSALTSIDQATPPTPEQIMALSRFAGKGVSTYSVEE